MVKLDKVVSKFVKLLDCCSQILLFFLMCFFVVYIVLRWFGYTIFGTIEIAQFTCLLIVCLALANNDYKGGNITVTVLTDMVPPLWQKIIKTFASVFTLGTVAVMEYALILYVNSKRASGALSSALKLPIWMFVVVICIGFLLLVVSVLAKLVQLWFGYTNCMMAQPEETPRADTPAHTEEETG